MEKHARLAVVLLALWTAFVVYRTAGYHELFGIELDRWSDDAFLVNLLALPAAIAALVFGVRWGMEGGVALREMNWKRGLKRLWLLTAIPWMIHAFGEYEAAREISNAWRYYTYDGTSVSNNKSDPPKVDSVDAAMDAYEQKKRQQAGATLDPKIRDAMVRELYGEPETLVNPLPGARRNGLNENGVDPEVMRKLHGDTLVNPLSDARRISPENAAQGLKLGRETGLDPAWAAENIKPLQEDKDLEQWNKILDEAPKTARFVAKSPAIAAAAQDNVDNLSAIEFGKLAQGIHKPNFDWVIPVLLFPTLGVAFVALALWLAFLAVRWTWRGFHS